MHSTGARRTVGPLSGEVAILDTPLLLRLLGGPPGRSAIVDLIGLGIGSGMEIVVHETTLIELNHLLDRHTEDAQRFETALGPHPNVGELGLQDDVLETWLQAHPIGSVGHLSWSQFRKRAADLRNDLRALGVKLVASKDWDIAQASLHARFNDSLGETIRSRGGYRHRVPIDHDARLLVHVSEARIRNPGNEKKVWPGSIVITTDSYMTAAFEAVAGKQEFPIAVTPAQWAGLLGSCSPPADAERLAGLVGEELSRRTLLARAAAIPVEVAIELARSVSVDHESAVDPYAIQLSLQEVLAEQPDLLDPSGSDARQLANAIVARRQQRMQRAYMQQRSATAAEIRRKESEVQDRERIALDALATAEARSDRVESLQQQLAAETRRRVTLTRIVLVLIPSLLGIAVIASSAAAGALAGRHLGLASIGLVIFMASGGDYILHGDRRWWEPVSGLVVGTALALLPLYL